MGCAVPVNLPAFGRVKVDSVTVNFNPPLKFKNESKAKSSEYYTKTTQLQSNHGLFFWEPNGESL